VEGARKKGLEEVRGTGGIGSGLGEQAEANEGEDRGIEEVGGTGTEGETEGGLKQGLFLMVFRIFFRHALSEIKILYVTDRASNTSLIKLYLQQSS
jgi:hypothetical protein